MRKLVVSTEGGEFITGTDVEEHELVETVAAWRHIFPASNFYLDGQRVSGDALTKMMAALASGPAVQAKEASPAPLPEPEKVQDYNETMQRAFNDIRKQHVEMARDLTESSKMIGQVLIDHLKQFADEAARQRELTRKSLADVDLLGRSVKVTEFSNVVAVAGSRGEAAASGRGRMTFGDLFEGFTRMFTGG